MSTPMHLTSILSLDETNKKKYDQYRLKGYNDADLLWRMPLHNLIKHQLEDYDILESNIPLLFDNIITINLSKNPILHFRAKHIENKHNLIMDYVHKEIFELKFISTENQLVDIFTKSLLEDKLIHIKNLLSITFMA
ncbi:Copia protein, partial [Mucuna pruriens]